MFYSNLLKGTTTDIYLNATEDGKTNYILKSYNGEAVFATTSPGTLPAQKAYLQLPNNNRYNVIGLHFEDVENATGIEGVEQAQEATTIYTPQGQRVSKTTKGIYIVNGKKVLMK